jgi:hypothetical protein
MLGTANKVIDNKFSPISINVKSSESQPSKSSKSSKNNSTSESSKTLQIQKLTTATTSSAYIVKESYVDNILNLFNNCNDNMVPDKLSGQGFEHWALDQKWAELQRKDNWFVLDKDPIKQRAIWSTILTESHS